jgi:hypothetical protein
MAAQYRPLVVGIFEKRAEAERAVNELRAGGFTDNQIGFAARGDEDGAATDSITDQEQRGGAREGLVMGAITGGAFGSIVGAAAAVLLPGIGPVIAGGILGAALTGAAAGAFTGGLVGALREWGLPEEEARYYEDEFEAGRTIVTVKTDDLEHQEAAIDTVRRNNGYDATSRFSDMTPADDTTGAPGTDALSAGDYPATEAQGRPINGGAVFVPDHDLETDSLVRSRVEEWVGGAQSNVDVGRPG